MFFYFFNHVVSSIQGPLNNIQRVLVKIHGHCSGKAQMQTEKKTGPINSGKKILPLGKLNGSLVSENFQSKTI